MEPFQFSLPNLGILGLTLGCLFCIGFVILKAKSALKDQAYFKRVYLFCGLYLLLVILLSTLATSGFFYDFKSFPPRSFVLFILILGVLLFLYFQKMDKGLRLLTVIPAHWLILFQVYRLGAEWILAGLHEEGLIPIELTLYGRNFDVLIGFLALPVAYLVWKNHKFHYSAAFLFNLFSIVSLVNIIWIAVMSFPSPFQRFETNLLTSYFPGILIPSFLAPVALFTSLLSIKQVLFQLKMEKKPVANR